MRLGRLFAIAMPLSVLRLMDSDIVCVYAFTLALNRHLPRTRRRTNGQAVLQDLFRLVLREF